LSKEHTIDYALRTTWQAVTKMYNEEAKNFGTSMTLGFTLLSIDPKTGTPSTALGPKMGIEATSLSRILKTLEERGFIIRKPNPTDGRGVLIHLTEAGLEKRSISKSVVLKFNEVIGQHLTKAQLKAFFEVTDCIQSLILNKEIYPTEKPIKA
jgi:DNA-binding MarR family transcriptional regulator